MMMMMMIILYNDGQMVLFPERVRYTRVFGTRVLLILIRGLFNEDKLK